RQDVTGPRRDPARGLPSHGRNAERARMHWTTPRVARPRGVGRHRPVERPAVKLCLAAVVLAVASLAACANGGGHGTATIWITRDRGSHVLLVGHVPAGLTAMQDRKSTRLNSSHQI